MEIILFISSLTALGILAYLVCRLVKQANPLIIRRGYQPISWTVIIVCLCILGCLDFYVFSAGCDATLRSIVLGVTTFTQGFMALAAYIFHKPAIEWLQR